ncbi:redoxin family protein [bacterium BD-1]|uniref:prolipoprotein diacylglyceryl transferase family protein n=1 Tax=Arenimonas sp. TaxID=1872635 RepID=UPI001E5B7D91|nr:redoxin family protein [Ottowia caeni]
MDFRLDIPELALGPLLLPGGLWLALALFAAALLAARWRRRGEREGFAGDERALWWALFAGACGARLAYVLLHAGAYADAPTSLLNLRDGGWSLAGGLAAVGGLLLFVGWRRPERRPGLVAGALGASLLLLLVGALSFEREPTRPPAPRFALERLADGVADDLHGRGPVLVVLWATWCPSCRRTLPRLREAAPRHPGIRIAYLNQGEARAEVQAYADEHALPAADVLLDPASRWGQAAGAIGYPTLLLLDADGRVAARAVGELSEARIAVLLATLGP